MKIALIIPNDFSVVWFCEHLVKNIVTDHELTVLSDIHSEYEYGHYLDIIESWGVNHKRIRFYRFFNPIKDLKYTIALVRLLKAGSYDMVFNVSTKPNIYGTFAAKIAGVRKIVCSVWGLGLSFSESRDIRTQFLRFFVKNLYRRAFNFSNNIWFTNKADHKYFVSTSIVEESKTILTKNYVNVQEFSPTAVPEKVSCELREDLGYSKTDQVVIMLSRLSWAKGVRQFCEAAQSLKDKCKNAKFLLVGPHDAGSIDCVPLNFIKKYEKSCNFKWIGFRRDVKELYSICDLAVYPSYYREGGYPRGLTEPMAMGKPVITTDSEHCSEAVDDGVSGLLVPIKNSEALADAMKKILDNKKLADKLGEESRLKAERELSEETIITGLLKKII